MILLQFLLLVVGYYIFCGIGVYAWAISEARKALGFWSFSIDNKYLCGICPYPKWMLFWLEWIAKGVKKICGN